MKRRWFNILTAISLFLCLATLAMWGTAQRVQHRSSYHHIERHGAVVQVDAGAYGWDRYGLFTWRSDTTYLYGQTYDRDFQPQGQATDEDIAEAGRMAGRQDAGESVGGLNGRRFQLQFPDSKFHLLTTYNRLTLYRRLGTWLAIPFYQMATITVLLPLAWLMIRQRRSAKIPKLSGIAHPTMAGQSPAKHMPTEKARAAAKKNPGGWVYEIRGYYGPDDHVPAQAVVGAWKVDEQGEIVGEFVPNPNFNEVA